jgi:glucosamine-6-phosphate deaminase
MPSQYVPHTKVPTLVFPTSAPAVRHVALLLDKLIRQHNAANKPTVLGLATGSTPVGLYRELIRLHRETGLDFSRVLTFNLDEYFPMPGDSPHSYRRWMHETLFQHINILPENVHIPDGTIPADQVEEHCLAYEQAIRKAGGLDVQILGIGRTGHIGFNEPGATRNSRTRMVLLDQVTRRDAAGSFFGLHNVPLRALTMGVGTILDAKQIVLLAFGEHKAKVVQHSVEGDPTDAIPASFLQRHSDCTFVIDQPAAAELTAVRRPWEVGPVTWTPERTRQAVMWLSLTTRKALLKLSEPDFAEHGLYELVREHGPAQALGRRIFADRMATLITEPAGTEPSDVLVFSPHPDDDVISMGGTLIRLVEGGHRVRIAYMTSGNFAVFDHDARRFADFVASFNTAFGIDPATSAAVGARILAALDHKQAGQCDSADVLAIKGIIRATEARAAALVCGVPPSQLSFLDLRFYRTGTAAKAPLHPQDVADVVALLQQVQPKQIYLAGEMSDPHGTHRICAEAIFQAVRQVRALGQHFEVWLYRGAWEEWEPHEIEMAVPLSPHDLVRKKDAIFRHQSQKDRAMFPGTNDPREFWQRAEDRNRSTAQVYDALGLPEYFALEAFVRWQEGGENG